jgi:hypothetical protein
MFVVDSQGTVHDAPCLDEAQLAHLVRRFSVFAVVQCQLGKETLEGKRTKKV